MIGRLGPTGRRVLAAIALALVLQLVGSILIDGYSSEFTIRSMLVLASLLGVASIGQTLVVLLGGIDLSTPFVIGFANVVAAQLYGDGMNFALVALHSDFDGLIIGRNQLWKIGRIDAESDGACGAWLSCDEAGLA